MKLDNTRLMYGRNKQSHHTSNIFLNEVIDILCQSKSEGIVKSVRTVRVEDKLDSLKYE